MTVILRGCVVNCEIQYISNYIESCYYYSDPPPKYDGRSGMPTLHAEEQTTSGVNFPLSWWFIEFLLLYQRRRGKIGWVKWKRLALIAMAIQPFTNLQIRFSLSYQTITSVSNWRTKCSVGGWMFDINWDCNRM